MDLPLPGEAFFDSDENESTVIASCFFTDEDDDARGILLVLRSEPPYYSILEIDLLDKNKVLVVHGYHFNIVPATAQYNDIGGCY
jgi:hypothetical protein